MTLPTISNVEHLAEQLGRIFDSLQREYCCRHNHPWLVAYSGGKDSTILLQMVWEMVSKLSPEKRNRQVIVVGNDTLVESPLVIKHLRDSLNVVEKAARDRNMPFDVRITEPAIDQTFWVSVIGRGYIPPTRNFRWCTDRMKILPTSRLLKDIVSSHGGAVLLIGTRRSESSNRRRGMEKRKVSARSTNRHDTIEGGRVFAPLADLRDEDVWMTLMQRRPPWGGTHRRLMTLYRAAGGGGECPLVLTKDDAPSCGSSSPRFGCWTCTVVAKDRSLRGLINSGHEDAEKMEQLSGFRDWLIELREDDSNRLPVRRDGNQRNRSDGSQVFGPFRIEIRECILDRLQSLEESIGEPILSPGELDCIRDVWWRDRISESSRLALQESVTRP